MRYMVVEHFKAGAGPVYARYSVQGRLMPEGVRYVNSWVSEDMDTCWQIIDADDPALIDVWTSAWADLADFTITPVVSSQEAAERA